ncbi:transposase [Streptomyces sp. NPDC087300]|uniref:transposase n=1 Tax=Streptomyces sp. NPDC087300 TaxID=3365780 RepID=UPI00381C3679
MTPKKGAGAESAHHRGPQGPPLFVMVTPADRHDGVAAREALFRPRLVHPEITILWADLAYAGTFVAWAKSFLHLTIKTVSRPKAARGFVIFPRRWVVESSPAWLLHARRNVRDYEIGGRALRSDAHARRGSRS